MSDKKHAHPQHEETKEFNVQGFWAKGGKIIAGIIIAILVIIGGYLGYKSFVSEPNEQKANDAIFHAQNYYAMDSLKLALDGDLGFIKIASKYSGTKAGKLAQFYAGSCYLRLGDYPNAIKYLNGFSSESKELQVIATGLLGDAYAENNQKDKAVSEYKKAGTMVEKNEYQSSEYLFRAALLSETLGKNDDAIALYKTIKEKYPRTSRGASVDKYLARLGVVE